MKILFNQTQLNFDGKLKITPLAHGGVALLVALLISLLDSF